MITNAADRDEWEGRPVVQNEAEMALLRERALAAASTGITIADARQPDMPLIFVNPAFEEITGYPAAAVLGKNCRFLQGADTDQTALAQIRAALATGQACRVTLKNYRRDGTPFWIDLALAAVRDEADTLTHFIGIPADITTRVQLARSQRLFADAGATLAESLDYEETLTRVAWLAVPQIADWCFVDVIGAGERGYRLAVAHADPAQTSQAATIRHFTAQAPGQVVEPQAQQIAALRPRLLPNADASQLRDLAGNDDYVQLLLDLHIHSLITVPLLTRGRVLGALTLITTAYSGRRFSEDELALAQELAQRCAQAIDNAELYRQSQEAVSARDRFVAVAAHEMRTPVTSAKGYLQLLERQLQGDALDRDRLELFAGRIGAGLDRLEALVSDLLDVTRIQQGRLDLDPAPCDLVDIGKVVIERAEGLEHRTKRTHRLILDAPDPVIGEWDCARLDQVVTNLVSNAVKYSPDGGEVRVQIDALADGQSQLAISDQGLGISPEEQRELFKPFARGAAVQRRISGTELGLYIVRQIIEAHGGTITVASTLGQGTTFTVTLPPTVPPEAIRTIGR
ncbi:MAG TPA: ATP-binding protein [Thermomicrobiales bacterium]